MLGEAGDACLKEGAAAEELPPSMHLCTDMCGCGFLRNVSGPRDLELVVQVGTWDLPPSDTGITVQSLTTPYPPPPTHT